MSLLLLLSTANPGFRSMCGFWYGGSSQGAWVLAARDTFNRADTSDIDGSTMSDGIGVWSGRIVTGPVAITSNQATKGSGSVGVYYDVTTAAVSKQRASLFPVNSQSLAPMVRIQSDGSGYFYYPNGSIYRYDAGVGFTSLASGVAPTAGSQVTLEADGSTLNAYENGFLRASATDATYATGRSGHYSDASGGVSDNWESYVVAGASYNLTLSEGAKGGDTGAGAYVFPRSVSEGVKAGDAVTLQYVTAPSLAEGVKAGDAGTTRVDFVAALAEGSKAGDSQSARLDAVQSTTEGAKAGDAQFGLLVFGLPISEGAKAGDVGLAGLYFANALSEGVKAGDAAASALAYLLSISEGAKAGDTKTVQVAFGPTVSEGVKAGDAASSKLIAAPSMSEGVKAGDAGSTIATMYVAIVEGIKGGDAALAIGIFDRLVAEGVIAADSAILEFRQVELRFIVVIESFRLEASDSSAQEVQGSGSIEPKEESS